MTSAHFSFLKKHSKSYIQKHISLRVETSGEGGLEEKVGVDILKYLTCMYENKKMETIKNL
jgi:hypothetical protein